MNDKKIKICFAASSGGHFEQIVMLKPMMDRYDSFVVTEKTKYKAYIKDKKMYYLYQVNRKEKKCIFLMLANIAKSIYILFKEKPQIIITTGVLATIPICLIGKVTGKKIIYIESFAKITSPTKTGKLIYKFADQFYVQWESMLDFYPDAIYVGGIY